MKNITVFILAIIAVITMLYMGINGIYENKSFGPFFAFVGFCTSIGLLIDIIAHFKERIRRGNIRKLGF
jgi:hypothetical protein